MGVVAAEGVVEGGTSFSMKRRFFGTGSWSSKRISLCCWNVHLAEKKKNYLGLLEGLGRHVGYWYMKFVDSGKVVTPV